MKVRDSSLGSVCLALEWLSFSDLLGRAVLQGQSFQLLRYLPFLPVAFHLLFAATSIPRLAYPSSQAEASPSRAWGQPGGPAGTSSECPCAVPKAVAKLSQMQNVVLSMVSGIAPSARSQVGQQVLVLEVLCLLLDIIAPKLRPVSVPWGCCSPACLLGDSANPTLLGCPGFLSQISDGFGVGASAETGGRVLRCPTLWRGPEPHMSWAWLSWALGSSQSHPHPLGSSQCHPQPGKGLSLLWEGHVFPRGN